VLIIFGTKWMRRNLGVVFMMCQRCKRPCAHTILRLHSWFTLFFIPVIPLGSRYLTVCSMCAGQLRIDATQAEQLRQAALAQAAPQTHDTADGPISTPEGAPDYAADRLTSSASASLMAGTSAGASEAEVMGFNSITHISTEEGPNQGQVPSQFCANCGHSLDASHAFCESCGSPVAP
jgi:hypothetical protein